MCYNAQNRDQEGISGLSIREMSNNKVGQFPEWKRLRGVKTLPRRGQVKSKIAANALHSIFSLLSRASSSSSCHYHPSPIKP
ncbi:hypothetical protein QN277_028303 [Acacia crassicarpa]|uniref:Uncharacterized protein n=1 Tax=Acacia crassicarpa TaxID=499986 RepID=A0AAE1MI51_9FABA|nr:hypothetical protein QN277_028303 [Acacia crassicarpa]